MVKNHKNKNYFQLSDLIVLFVTRCFASSQLKRLAKVDEHIELFLAFQLFIVDLEFFEAF